jgi:hypothetical protein
MAAHLGQTQRIVLAQGQLRGAQQMPFKAEEEQDSEQDWICQLWLFSQ